MTEGRKDDAGKLNVGALFQDFPHAMEAIAVAATEGVMKYGRGNWKTIPDLESRYTDALGRHLIEHHKGMKYEITPAGEKRHLAAAAWCLLALLEYDIRRSHIPVAKPKPPAAIDLDAPPDL